MLTNFFILVAFLFVQCIDIVMKKNTDQYLKYLMVMFVFVLDKFNTNTIHLYVFTKNIHFSVYVSTMKHYETVFMVFS